MNLNILQMMFELFNNYYGLPDYADEVLDIIYDSHFTNPSSSKFIRAALFGKMGAKSRIPFDFTNKADIFRVECAQKASSYWSGWLKKKCLKLRLQKKGLKTWLAE